jgi:glycosyltransferase involved in cell wall biosynthesis
LNNYQHEFSKVSIGLPVYNGELFLKKAIDSILSQTYSNFELIISDNDSTDLTQKICQEYAKDDKRIQYIKQEKNIGAFSNFYFVLTKARSKYFMWAAVDDYWDVDFIKKNIDVLESNSNIVCSISKIDTYGFSDDDMIKHNIPTVNYPKFLKSFVKNRRKNLICTSFSISGFYNKKIRLFLKNPGASSRFYGLYRTDQIKECYMQKQFIGVEFAISLNLLKLGDFFELDETLFHRFDSGWSTYGIINMAKKTNSGILGIMFPYYPFNLWCMKNIGIKNIFRNFDIFTRMNVGGTFFVGVDLILKIKNSLF